MRRLGLGPRAERSIENNKIRLKILVTRVPSSSAVSSRQSCRTALVRAKRIVQIYRGVFSVVFRQDGHCPPRGFLPRASVAHRFSSFPMSRVRRYNHVCYFVRQTGSQPTADNKCACVPWSCSSDEPTRLTAMPSRTRSRTHPTNPVSVASVHTPGGTFLRYVARPPNPNIRPFCRCSWLESPADVDSVQKTITRLEGTTAIRARERRR